MWLSCPGLYTMLKLYFVSFIIHLSIRGGGCDVDVKSDTSGLWSVMTVKFIPYK